MRFGTNAAKLAARFLNAIFYAVAAMFVCAVWACAAEAVALDKGERVSVALVTPVANNTELRVWMNKYYPGDILPEKMTNYMLRRMREIPRVNVEQVSGAGPDYWDMMGSSRNDLVIETNLEQLDYYKKDTLGSRVQWDIVLHIYVYNSSKRLIYDTVVRESDVRHYVLYTDTMERGPIYWEKFEKSPYWPALRHAMDEGLDDVLDGYNGYRIVGRIVSRAERVDGSLSVPRKKTDKIYHIDLGLEDSVQVGDILSVTRASSVRTVAPETPEMHFPQIVGRVRVIFVKGRDGVVEVVKESSDAPIQLGDALSAPLREPRRAKSAF